MTTNEKTSRRWVELETILDRSGWTQTDLYKAVNHPVQHFSRSHLSDMITGRRNVTPANRKRMAEALKVPTVVLIPALEEQ